MFSVCFPFSLINYQELVQNQNFPEKFMKRWKDIKISMKINKKYHFVPVWIECLLTFDYTKILSFSVHLSFWLEATLEPFAEFEDQESEIYLSTDCPQKLYSKSLDIFKNIVSCFISYFRTSILSWFEYEWRNSQNCPNLTQHCFQSSLQRNGPGLYYEEVLKKRLKYLQDGDGTGRFMVTDIREERDGEGETWL